MRADARKNYSHLLAVASAVVSEQGAEASLRDIARRADVGLATLYRHFPTREALLEALLHARFDELTQTAAELEASASPDEALLSWFREAMAFTHTYGGVFEVLAVALADAESALHASCAGVRSAGAQLLERAQAAGLARTDIDGTDLLALIAALGWLSEQPPFTSRADHLVDVIAGAVLTRRKKR